jgi:enediyne biosynthesis protein E4
LRRKIFKIIRIIIYILLIVVIVACAAVAVYALRDKKEKYSVDVDPELIPQFTAVDVDFRHSYQSSRGLPYASGAVIDIDNDGIEELFLGGGVLQADGLFRLEGDHFVNVVEQAGIVKQGDEITLDVAVIDVDNNGFDDLIVSRESALWLYSNENGRFTVKKLDIEFPEKAVPLGVSIVDINRDGKVDLFVSFVSRTSSREWFYGERKEEGIPPRLYVNKGDNSFFDVTQIAGLGELEEALHAVFADLDNDGLEDLTLLHTSGRLSTWKNLGNLLFEHKAHFHTNKKGFFMGLALADYDNNGRPDLLLTNRGSTQPQFITDFLHEKDEPVISEWVLLNSSGFFSFRDDAERAQLSAYELSRGAMFTDLNNDGLQDLVVSQNHPYWPTHLLKQFRLPGRMFVQTGAGEFAEIGSLSGVVNPSFGVTPLQADFNNDGYPDIVQVNLDDRSRIFLSKPGEKNYLKIDLANNARSLGAMVRIKMASGTILEVVNGLAKEFCGDSTPILLLGIGKEKAIDITVQYSNGEKDQTSGVFFNTTVAFD